jgi:hypothetical protein
VIHPPPAANVPGLPQEPIFSPAPHNNPSAHRQFSYSSLSNHSDADSDSAANPDQVNSESTSKEPEAAPKQKRKRASATGDITPIPNPAAKQKTGTPRNGGFAIADMMGKYIDFQQSQVQATSAPSFEALATQRAIGILNDEYIGSLDGDEMAKGYEVMMNFSNANAFCVMGRNTARDTWLMRQISKIN